MRLKVWQKWVLTAWVVCLLLAAIGCALRTTPAPPVRGTKELPTEFDILKEAWQVLEERSVYKGDLDAQEMSRAALRGMMEALGDPYAAFLEPSLSEMQQQDQQGSFQGIGAKVADREGYVVILEPLPGTPAERAGLRPGDLIVSVDGRSTEGMGLYEVVLLIRGPRGTTVTLDILREGEPRPLEVPIIRDVIDVPSVVLEMLPQEIAHLKIEEFSHDTDEELERALEMLLQQGAKGVVLDLRDNLGGVLDAVVRVASYFLEDGLVLYEVDGDGVRRDWSVEKVEKRTDIPMVVLVNQFTASGAEVLAGALRDRGQAALVGAKTFGKGSVNNLWTLSDGSAIYFSISRWYTPGGTLIEGGGLEPDYTVAPSSTGDTDPQMEKALEVLRQRLGSS